MIRLRKQPKNLEEKTNIRLKHISLLYFIFALSYEIQWHRLLMIFHLF